MGISAKYHKSHLNYIVGEINDLTMPDVRTLVDATQGGVSRHINLTMGDLDVLKNPTGAKYDGGKAHRRVMATEREIGLVSIAVPNDLFCANTVGAFGAASAGGSWGRISSAVRRP